MGSRLNLNLPGSADGWISKSCHALPTTLAPAREGSAGAEEGKRGVR